MVRDFDRVSEEYLTVLAQERDPEAFESLYQRTHSCLLRYAQFLIDDAHEAADVVQEAWISIHRGLPHLRDPAAFRAWSFRVVNRRCADHIRKKQRRRQVESQARDASDGPDQQETSGEELRLRELVAGLPPDRRGLIELVYHENLSLPEVSVALDIPVGTVKSRLHHTRELLKQRLNPTRHEKR